MHLVVKLSHLRDHTIFFKQYFVHACRLVIVVGHIPIIDGPFEDLRALLGLSFFGQIIHVFRFWDHKAGRRFFSDGAVKTWHLIQVNSSWLNFSFIRRQSLQIVLSYARPKLNRQQTLRASLVAVPQSSLCCLDSQSADLPFARYDWMVFSDSKSIRLFELIKVDFLPHLEGSCLLYKFVCFLLGC